MYRSPLVWLFSLAFFASGGCTKSNPDFRETIKLDASTNPVDMSVSDANVVIPVDLTNAPDLRPAPPDFAVPACVEGARFCNDNKIIACEQGDFVLDRQCPSGSACVDASCQPPPLNPATGLAGSNCAGDNGPSENFCLAVMGLNLSCQPFLSGGDVIWRCATAIGSGVPATDCNSDQGAKCRTGFCGDNGTCFRTCVDDNQCPNFGNQQTTCESAKILVEGKTVSAKSCVPQN